MFVIALMACNAQRSTPTVVAAANVTPTPAATSTPPEAEATATAAPEATATPEAVPTALPQLAAYMQGPVTTTLKSSTNAYEATLINDVGATESNYSLTIDRALGGNKWTVVREKKNTAGAQTILVPMGWSDDERFFYFARMSASTGADGNCGVFLRGAELNQANVATRRLKTFNYDNGPLALSPNTATIAQVVYESLGPATPRARANRRATATPTPVATTTGPQVRVSLVLRDVGGRRARTVVLSAGTEVKTFQAGSIVWKPDGSAVMLAYAHNACSADASYSLVEINTQSLKPRIVVDKDTHRFTPRVWAEGGWVELLDREQKRWLLDPSNGQAVPAG